MFKLPHSESVADQNDIVNEVSKVKSLNGAG
jgi:hypothetical protein